MGCMLGQHDESGKKERAVYYLSKKFTTLIVMMLHEDRECYQWSPTEHILHRSSKKNKDLNNNIWGLLLTMVRIWFMAKQIHTMLSNLAMPYGTEWALWKFCCDVAFAHLHKMSIMLMFVLWPLLMSNYFHEMLGSPLCWVAQAVILSLLRQSVQWIGLQCLTNFVSFSSLIWLLAWISISVGCIANCYPPHSSDGSLLMADIRCLPGVSHFSVA